MRAHRQDEFDEAPTLEDEAVGHPRVKVGRFSCECFEGRYRVGELIASTVDSELYRAEQICLGRMVAIKVPRAPSERAPGVTEAYRREALALAQLGHGAPFRILELGSHRGVPFLVLERAK